MSQFPSLDIILVIILIDRNNTYHRFLSQLLCRSRSSSSLYTVANNYFNSTFSVSIIHNTDASRVTLLYGIFEIGLIATYLVVFWKLGWSKAPADENFCTVIAKSYEISHDEDDHTNDNDNDEENVEQQQQQQQDEEMMMVAEEVKNNRAEVVNNDWDTEEKGGDGGTTANDDDDDDDINDNDRDGEEEKEEEEEDTIIKVSDFRDENTGSSNTRISNDGDASGGDSGDGVGIINTSQYQ